MKVLYRPVTLLNQKVTNTFRCLPVADRPGGGTVRGKAALRHLNDVRKTAELNASVLVRAFADLSRANDLGHRFRLIVPVNSYALASGDASTRIVHAVKGLAPELRRTVIVEIFQFPKSMTLDSLDEITIPLLPFFENFMAEPEPGMDDFILFANCNYFGVSLDVEGRGLEGADALDRLTGFWAETVKKRLKLIVQGIADREIAVNARKYDAFAMDGPALGSDSENLEPAEPAAGTA